MIAALVRACILGATASLAIPFAVSGRPIPALLAAAAGVAGVWLGWRDAASLGLLPGRHSDALLVAQIAAAAWGIAQDLPPAAMLGATVLALAAWDLALFRQRLEAADRVEDRAGLERGHLARLALVSGAGLGLGLLALYIRLRLTLATGLLLALLAILALSRAITLAVRSGKG